MRLPFHLSLFLILCLNGLFSCSDGSEEVQTEAETETEIDTPILIPECDQSLLIAVRDTGGWSYMRTDGTILSSERFEAAGPFSGSYAVVYSEDHGESYLDREGKRMEVSLPGRNSLSGFHADRTPRQEASAPFFYGYANPQGNWAIPAQFEDASSFDGEALLARVMMDGKTGIINASGEFVIPASYDYVAIHANGFLQPMQDGKKGLATWSGEMLCEPTYDSICDFNSPLLRMMKDGKWGYLSRDGTELIAPQYDEVGPALGDGPLAVKTDERWSFVDQQGKITLPPSYLFAKSFSEDLASVSEARYMGYINESGEFVIPPTYGTAGPFANGVAVVTDDDGYKLIDRDNNIIPGTISELLFYHPQWDVAVVVQNGKQGLLKGDGTVLYPATADLIMPNFGSQCPCFTVTKNKKKGLVRLDGSVIAPIEYLGFGVGFR